MLIPNSVHDNLHVSSVSGIQRMGFEKNQWRKNLVTQSLYPESYAFALCLSPADRTLFLKRDFGHLLIPRMATLFCICCSATNEEVLRIRTLVLWIRIVLIESGHKGHDAGPNPAFMLVVLQGSGSLGLIRTQRT